jgi:hypothetical protein
MNIYPNKNNPYYIVAPFYTPSSAGIRLLYLLCHHLNLKGFQAYIMRDFYHENHEGVFDLLAPEVTDDIANYHFKQNRTPIIVYPEVIPGNPVNGPVVCRYVLNYPGFLGGDKTYAQDELIFAFSETLAKSVPDRNPTILYMPICDTNIFYPPNDPAPKRTKKCFYASKYLNVHKGKLFEITKDCFEITRQLPDSLTQLELADLLRESEILYCYEDSTIATEATLCGCPVVFIPNEFMQNEPLATKEVGLHGYSFGFNEKDILRAKESVHLAYKHYLETVNNFFPNLDRFISITQDKANSVQYKIKINILVSNKKERSVILYENLLLYYRNNGFNKTILKIILFILKIFKKK